MGSRPTLEQVEAMINEPMKQRGKQIDFVKLSNTTRRTPKSRNNYYTAKLQIINTSCLLHELSLFLFILVNSYCLL